MSDKPKILIIDDDYASLTSTKMILSAAYEVTAMESPKKALDLLENQIFDLILLDIFIPEMNGIEVLKKLKAQYPSIPVIVLSGSVEWITRRGEVKEHGAADYILKPYGTKNLQTKINEILTNK